MFATTIKILKILYQTEITKKNLMLNLNLTESAILKAIHQTNIYLNDLKLRNITVDNQIFSLYLTEKEWNIIFNSINTLTFEEKIDYLYIKFIYFGFINLEKEKDILNISRSSLNRCFLVVKKSLVSNNSKFTYENGKGNKILYISEYNRNIFAVKIMKLFFEEDILINSQKDLLNSLINFNIKTRISQLINLFVTLKIPVSNYMLYFLCSLSIYVNKFESFHKENNINTNEKNDLMLAINSIGFNFSEFYKKELFQFLFDLSLDKQRYFEDIMTCSKNIAKTLFKKFKINETSELNNMLIEKIYLGIFKKKYNFLKIRNLSLNNNDEFFIETLNSALKKENSDMYLCDKFEVIIILKKEILQTYILKIKSILILLDYINLEKEAQLKIHLTNRFPTIKFDTCHIIHNKNETYYKNYDIYIDNTKFILENRNIYSLINQEIENFIVKNLINSESA